MVRSGLCWDKGCEGGVGFWGANGHDGIWHIALISSLSRGSLEMPVFSGWSIQNYHIGFDLILSWIVRITGVSPSVLYFQITAPVLAFLIGVLTYKFVFLWKKSYKASLWAVFFVYFGGSCGWLVSLFKGQGWGGESMFWSQQSISTLINPPFALSLVFILSGLINLKKYLDTGNKLNFILTAFFFGISMFIKVYAGLLVLTALLACGLYSLIINHQSSIIKIFLLSLSISLLLFLPFNRSSAGLISWQPFWFLESMMALSDRVGWQKMYSAMTTYRMGHIWIKAVATYIFVFLIFIIGNFGTRIIAFTSLLKNPKKLLHKDSISLFIFIVIFAGIVVPMFFVQIGVPWNTIQFFYYSLIFSGIAAGIVLERLIREEKFGKFGKYAIGLLVILLTIPTTISSLNNYLSKKPHSTLPATEIEALNFLKSQPDGIVLTYPYTSQNPGLLPHPTPLYLYTSTAYVSAFSEKPVFLEDQINLIITQYPWEDRRLEIEEFLNTLDIETGRKFLKDNNISYIYWLKDQHARIGDKQLGMTNIFQNDNVVIFKVD